MENICAHQQSLEELIEINQRYIEELQKELLCSRLKVAATQMQPHFLYNALSSIRAIVKTDPDCAYNLIYDFSTHLRGCIKAMSSDALVSFRDELANIKAYINIEQMRYGDKLRVVFDTPVDNFLVAPLSIQPIVENAVRHGIFERGKAGGTVIIRSRQRRGTYFVEIMDDGVGFDVNTVLGSQDDHVGIKNTLFRCTALMNARVTINSVIDTGTRVEIAIPERSSLC